MPIDIQGLVGRLEGEELPVQMLNE